jgi:hypothetical protein
MFLLLSACVRSPPEEVGPCVEQEWYADGDHDGWGVEPITACAPPSGYTANGGDCDDGDPDANPGATESCTLGDDNCDGVVDPDDAEGCVPDWVDADGDGVGSGDPVCTCAPVGVAVGGDCDDADDDRAGDCTEGTVVPLVGDRLLDDDPATNWWLLAAEDDLVLAGPDGFVRAALPTGDALLSANMTAMATLEGIDDQAAADLDGDGQIEPLAVRFSAVVETPAEDASDYDDLRFTGELQRYDAALTPESVITLPDVVAQSSAAYLFTADTDGDARAEAWCALSVRAGYVGASALWRIDDTVVEVARVDDDSLLAATSVGDVDGDGLDDLAIADGGDRWGFYGGVGDQILDPFTTVYTDATLITLGDLDGDGYGEVGLREETITVLRGPALDAVAVFAAESDDPDASALNATAGDLGGDGQRDLLVSDTFWPDTRGATPVRGALYVFRSLPTGRVDLIAADERIYGAEYGAFGAYPKVLDDGRVLVGAHLETTEVGTGAFWLLDL